MLNHGHAADDKAFADPLKLAIAQIVQKVPPFNFEGARSFSSLPEDVQALIEDWCSNAVVDTAHGYWFTGSSVVDAAELLVNLAIESGNLGE